MRPLGLAAVQRPRIGRLGVVLVVVTQGAPEGARLLAAGVRDLAFAEMGAALLDAKQAQPQ